MSTIQDPPMQVLQLKYHGGISMYILLPESDVSQVSYSCPFHWGDKKTFRILLIVFLSLVFKVVRILVFTHIVNK